MNIENQLVPATSGVPTYPDGRMDTKSAASYTGFSEKTLATWRSNGIGPDFVRVGSKKIFYTKESLDRFIAAGQSATPQNRARGGK